MSNGIVVLSFHSILVTASPTPLSGECNPIINLLNDVGLGFAMQETKLQSKLK